MFVDIFCYYFQTIFPQRDAPLYHINASGLLKVYEHLQKVFKIGLCKLKKNYSFISNEYIHIYINPMTHT